MVATERLQIVIEALNQSRGELEKLKKDLGGVAEASDKSREEVGGFGDALKLIKQIGIGISLFKATQAITKFGKESALVAARVETLGVVTKQMGKNMGLSVIEVRELERSIQDQGITTQASRQALAQMAQAQIDMANATDLARIAQNAAVIANTDSSDAFQRLVAIVARGNVRMARNLGLQVSFQGAYERMAGSIGKTTQELTKQEKIQARVNEIMRAGEGIAGTYEAAMETAGKQMGSYRRHFEELQVEVGKLFQDELSAGIKVLTKLTDQLKDTVSELNEFDDGQKSLKEQLEAGEISVREYRQEVEELFLANKDQNRAWQAIALALENNQTLTEEQTMLVYGLSQAEMELRKNLDEVTRTTKMADENMLSYAGSTRDAADSTGELGETADELDLSNIAEELDESIEKMGEYDSEVFTLTDRFRQFRSDIMEHRTRPGDVLLGMKGIISGSEREQFMSGTDLAPEPQAVTHLIEFGDTLSGIAADYDTTVSKLLELNEFIEDPNLIFVGDQLKLPFEETLDTIAGSDSIQSNLESMTNRTWPVNIEFQFSSSGSVPGGLQGSEAPVRADIPNNVPNQVSDAILEKFTQRFGGLQ